MRRFWLTLMVLTVLFAGLRVTFGQGPLTNALNLMVRTDSNGSLYVYGVVAGAQGPLRNFGNTMLRTYAPGSLAVTIAGGTVTPDVLCVDGTNQDTCLRRVSASVLALRNGTVDQEFQIGPATSYLDLIKINGSVAAIRNFDAQSLYLGVNNSNIWSVDGTTGNFLDLGTHQIMAGGGYQLASKILFSATAPTISGFAGSSPAATVTSGSTTAAFRIGVGGTAPGATGTILLPTATTGWNCWIMDQTTPLDITRQTSSTTSQVGITSTIAWTANDILVGGCAAF